jgi:2-succinyl-5-enolpyruvyl-6-hydroxy-3-cyclohexene-1-carboxylate synthase
MNASTPLSQLPPRVLVGVWCSAIFERAAALGVRDVVISPGSRSTPLAVAALRMPALRCHSIVDERSAGFFALGLARASRAPVLLLCTSGTAAAHYYPAVIEASYDGVPLLVVSADRPEELQNCGAPQTIEQKGLFGIFVRAAASIESPSDTVDAFCFLGTTIKGLLGAATSERPGPVHLNVPLRKPLEPEIPESEFEKERAHTLLAASRPPTESALTDGEESAPLADVAALILARSKAKRPLITAGPLSPFEVEHFLQCARALEAPVLSEYGAASEGGLEFLGPHLSRDYGPDLLVHFGPPAVSSTWAKTVEQYQGSYLVLSGSELRDPSRRAESLVVAPLARVAAALNEALLPLRSRAAPSSPAPSAVVFPTAHDPVQSLRQPVQKAIERALARQKGADTLSEPLTVATVLSACTPEHSLVLGNSLSLRLASWVWPSIKQVPHPFTARGVNGIDGTVAWSLGVAVATRRPTLCLLGDVTMAHDIGSLQLLPRRSIPICFVVLDNGGGRIFDHLPVGGAISVAEMAFWTTPPNIDFVAAAQGFGVTARRITQHSEIQPAVAAALASEGPSLLVVSTDPASTASFLAEVRGEFSA